MQASCLFCVNFVLGFLTDLSIQLGNGIVDPSFSSRWRFRFATNPILLLSLGQMHPEEERLFPVGLLRLFRQSGADGQQLLLNISRRFIYSDLTSSNSSEHFDTITTQHSLTLEGNDS